MMISIFSAKHKLHLVVIFGLPQQAPLDVVADLLIFQGLDVPRQGRTVTVSDVPNRMLARIITLLEGLRAQTSVIRLLARRRDGCPVRH